MNRREWCFALAKLVSPSFPTEAQKALVEMLPALQHLPDTLFTADTVLEVAGAKRRQSVPAWDEIVGALHRYRDTYLPDPRLRLAAPAELPADRAPPSDEERAEVARIVSALRPKQGAVDGDTPERPMFCGRWISPAHLSELRRARLERLASDARFNNAGEPA